MQPNARTRNSSFSKNFALLPVAEFHVIGSGAQGRAHFADSESFRMSKGVSKMGKAIDWEYLNKVVVSADGKRELQALRRAYDDVAATIQDKFTIRPQSIYWDLYKEKLGPGIVNIFENSINSLDKEVPDYECEFTEDYKAKHRSLLTKAAEKEEDSKKKIIAIDKELKRVGDEKEAMATITVDEYYSKYPAVGAKIDDEIRNHIWG